MIPVSNSYDLKASCIAVSDNYLAVYDSKEDAGTLVLYEFPILKHISSIVFIN